MLLFFDKGLLALGNILFLAGTTLLIGFRRTISFFTDRRKLRGTICFFGGAALVLAGWPVVGMLIEALGIINLFGNFFPLVINGLRHMPVIGTVLNLPVIRTFVDYVSGAVLPYHHSKH